MKKLLYVTALDADEKLIRIKDAVKGNKYLCPHCKSELILRKSEKGVRRPHFAHKSLSPNCSPETVLHYSFKTMLAESINHAITKKERKEFKWDCHVCGKQHVGNFTKKASIAKVEKKINEYKPDIFLVDKKNIILAAIEVVVTHKPTEKAMAFYKKNGISLIQYNLNDESELDDIESRLSRPDFVDFCLNPRCTQCGEFKKKKVLIVINGLCWKCNSVMKVAIIVSENYLKPHGTNDYVTPYDFTKSEIDFAKSKNVILKNQYSQTMRERYLANSCGKCGAFAGEFHLFTQYIFPGTNGELQKTEYDMGYFCDNCDS